MQHVAIRLPNPTERQMERLSKALAAGDTTLVHPLCRTVPGRRKVAKRLVELGLKPAAVSELGWGTSLPVEDPKVFGRRQPEPKAKPRAKPKPELASRKAKE